MKFIPPLLLIPLLTAVLHAQTAADLAPAALAGKTVTCTITGGNAPFESSGTFAVQLGTPAAGQYTIPVSSGNTTALTGTYTATTGTITGSSFTSIRLDGYVVGGGTVTLELYPVGVFGAVSHFEMYGNGPFNKHGTFTVGAGGATTPAPVVTAQPAAAQNIGLGGSVTFTFTVTGTGITYQWYFNGVAIVGAINFSYTIGSVTAAHAGTYTVTATNAGGSVTSNASLLTVAAASDPARLSNVSIRAGAGSDSQTLIVGLTIGGAGTAGNKTLLVRGTGPALIPFGVTGALADPVLTVFNGSTVIASNDDWNSDAQVAAQNSALGAFPLTVGSKDSALVGTVAPAGGYTVQLTGKAGATGIGLVEVYDATASFTAATPRLTNVSARTQVGTGGNVLITGFVIAGNGTRQVLIRATGPALVPFGVTGALVDPKLELFDGAGVKTDENDNWVGSTAAAQTAAGAFALTAGSKDAVLVATLAPGSYTAQVSGVGGTTGVALVEIYELP